MGYKIKGLVATTNELSPTGMHFSEEALKQMSKSAKNIPVLLDYDHDVVVGSVESAKLTEKGLELNVQIYNTIQDFTLPLFLVPGGRMEETHQEDGIMVIDKLNITDYSLCVRPADDHLTPIEKID